MRHRLFGHIVWTTENRAPQIDLVIAAYLAGALPELCEPHRARVLAMGIVATHLHLLVRLHPGTDIPRLVQAMKGTSSHAVAHGRCGVVRLLRWSKGYSIESVSSGSLLSVAEYLATQHLHHRADAIEGWQQAPAELNAEFVDDTRGLAR